MNSVAPSARELQFIDSTVGFGATGNMPEIKQQVRKIIATVLRIFPQISPSQNEGGLPRLPYRLILLR